MNGKILKWKWNRPEIWCLLGMGLLMCCAGAIISIEANAAIDIPLHDTYFVTTSIQNATMLIGILALMGWGYRWLNMSRVSVWTGIHIGSMILWSIGIVSMPILLDTLAGPAPHYFQYAEVEKGPLNLAFMDLSMVITFSTVWIFCIQIIFLAVLFRQLLRRG
ncbi:MAG: hypothetical protein AAFW00_05745 [Bacteroidota bacterium]